MYDPNLDAEERLRKIAMQQLMANNKDMAADIKVAPKIDVPEVAVPPPEAPEAFMMDKMMASLDGSNMGVYQGMAPINPIGMTPVQRGGGMLTPAAVAMGDYGTGIGGVGILDAITRGGSSSSSDSEEPQDWPDFFQKMLQNKLTKIVGG